MKLIISGNNNFSDYELLKDSVNEFLIKHRHDEIEMIISSGEPGAEQLGEQFARENEIPLMLFTPDVATFGEEAQVISDTQMVDTATALIVFWDGVSSGKARKQDQAKKKGMLTEVVNYGK